MGFSVRKIEFLIHLVKRFSDKFKNYRDKVDIYDKKFSRSVSEYYYQKNLRELKNTVKAHIKTNGFLKENKGRLKEAFKMYLFYNYRSEFNAKVKRKDLRMVMADRKKWNQLPHCFDFDEEDLFHFLS